MSKLPKIEGMSLHDLLVDEPPSVEVTNSGMGINGIRSILELQNFGIALCKGAHLGNLRAFSHKFLSFLTVRLDSDLGLRCPNVLEAQSADKAIWGSISDLLNEQNWSLDECLCEFSMCVQTLLHYYSQGQKLRSLRWYLRHGDQMTKGAKARAKKRRQRQVIQRWQRQANLDIGIPTQWGVEADLHEVPIQQLSARQLSLCTRLRISKVGQYNVQASIRRLIISRQGTD